MNSAMKKGSSIFLGLVIILSLVYINMDSARAANSITGEAGAVWYDDNGTPIDLTGVTVYLDNAGTGVVTSAGGFGDVTAASPSFLRWDGPHYLTYMADGFRTVTYNVDNTGAPIIIADGSVQMELEDSIYGRVVGTDGQPIAGVFIEALDYVTHALVQNAVGYDAVTRTDQFGNFVLKGLVPDTYDIRASKDGEYVSQVSTAVRVIRGQTTTNINYTLSVNYGAIEGHVSNGNAPIAGATVSIPGLGISTLTDSNGHFRLDGVAPGGYTLTCEKSGYLIGVLYYDDSSSYANNPSGLMEVAPFIQPGPPVTPIPADFNLAPTPLTPTTGYISGIVTDVNGNALEGAIVEIPGLELLGFTDFIRTTDKSGYYIFEEVPNGEYDVVVTDPLPIYEDVAPYDPGRLCHKTAKARVNVIPDLNADANFALEENPGFLVGQIRDKDDLPVSDVAVSIPNSTISALTDINGWYVLQGINAERYTIYDYQNSTIEYIIAPVVVRADESSHYLNTLVATPLPANGTAESFEAFNIRIFPKTGTIKGIVSSLANGIGIENAKVRVYGRACITDSSGMYEITNVPIGSYTVVADDNNINSQYQVIGDMEYAEFRYDLVYETSVPVTFGHQTRLDFALPDATTSNYGYVSGITYQDIISDSSFNEGEGVPGVTVEVPGYPTIDSDDFGFYIVKADDGLHNLVAYDEDYEWFVSDQFVDFPADAERVDVNLEMDRRTGELIGNVSENHPITGTPDPVDSATLWAPGYVNTAWYWLMSESVVNSDFYGNYAFANILNGEYNAQLTKGMHLIITQKWATPYTMPESGEYFYEYEFNYVTIASTATKDISLVRETGRVEGQVWDDLNDNGNFDYPTELPLSDADVSLSKLYPATSDSSGYYTILDVPVTKDYIVPEEPQLEILSNGIYAPLSFWVSDPDYEVNRYTGVAYLTGYTTETFEQTNRSVLGFEAYNLTDNAPNSIIDRVNQDPEYQFCNNIPVYEEVFYADVTKDIQYPLNKADPLPVTGSVSGYVDLQINDINAEAEVWIQGSYIWNTWSDIEGFWIILGSRTYLDVDSYTLEPGVTAGAYYAIEAKKPHYVTSDSTNGIVFNVPIIAGSETDGINFTLPKDGSIEGHVYEDVDRDGTYDALIDVPVSGATVSIANLSVLSDSNGYYRIDNIYSNDPYNVGYVVSCTKDGYSYETIQQVDVDHGTGTGNPLSSSYIPPEDIDGDYSPFLLTKPEGLIIGRAVDAATMSGIAGIDIKAMDDDIETNQETVVTDDYGYYVFQSNRSSYTPNQDSYTLQAPEVVVIDDCEATDDWAAVNGTAPITTSGFMGYNSVCTTGDGLLTTLELNKTFTSPIDISGNDFITFYVRFVGVPDTAEFVIDDGTTTDVIDLGAEGYVFNPGAWTKVSIDMDAPLSVDLTNIDYLGMTGTYADAATQGTATICLDHIVLSDTWVPRELFGIGVTYYGATPGMSIEDAITRPIDFVLYDETTMPDNNVFGLVSVDASTEFLPGEDIVVSIPGLGLFDYPVSTEVTNPDGISDNGDEHNFIFNDIPNDPGKEYTVVAKRAIPGTSPTKYMVEYATAVTTNTQVLIDMENAPATPYDSWVEGIVFWDMNENGVVDSNERLAGVDVYLPGSSADNLPGPGAFLSEVTDSTGYYIINEIPSELDNVPTKFTVLARDEASLYELGIQRNLPFMGGEGDWIDFPLEKATSYDFAYLEGEVFYDANGNGVYDVTAPPNPSSEGVPNAIVTANPSQVTDSFGYFIFDDLDAEHTYDVTVAATGYEDHNEFTYIGLGDNIVAYSIEKLSNSISGHVFEDVDDSGDWSTGDVVIKAKVIAVKDGSETFESYTDVNGYYFIPGITQGTYNIECVQIYDVPELPEYQDWIYLDNPLDITSNDPVTLDIAMSRYFVNVTGTTMSGGAELPGVTVEWFTEGSGFTVPVFTTTSDESGSWDLLDWTHDIDESGDISGNEEGAPVGSWYVKFSLNGYNTVTRWITLTYDDYLNAPIDLGDIVLTPELDTGITGSVVDELTNPIAGATIKATDISTSDEFFAVSAADGSYTLLLEPADYQVEAFKLGFEDYGPVAVTIDVGELETLPISMTSTGGFGNIVVDVTDGSGDYEGALVTVWYKDVAGVYDLIAEDTTDASGDADFLLLPAGLTYYVCVSDNANSMIMEVEEAAVVNGDTTTVNIALEAGTSSDIDLPDAGWYLITPPVLLRDDVFWPAMLYASGIDMTPDDADTNSDMVAIWNNTTDSYEYYDATYGNVTEFDLVEPDVGYWLHMKDGGLNLEVVGEVATSPRVIDLPGGHWSLIGYTSLYDGNPIATNMDVAPAGAVNLMWTYDIPPTSADLYDPYGRFANGFETFEIWHAIWVYPDVDCTLTITTVI